MNLDELLRRLGSIGARLERSGERIAVEAPDGVLTPEIRAAISEHRDELLAGLDGAQVMDLATERLQRRAWTSAVRELGEAAGWPEVAIEPHRLTLPGAANWGRFLARASVPDLRAACVSLREYLATLGAPGSINVSEDDRNEVTA